MPAPTRRVRAQAIYQRHTAFNCGGAVLARVLRLPLVLEFNSSELWKGQYWGGLHLTRAAALVVRLSDLRQHCDRGVAPWIGETERHLAEWARMPGC